MKTRKKRGKHRKAKEKEGVDKNPLLEQPTGKPNMAPGFHSLIPKPTVFLFQLTLGPFVPFYTHSILTHLLLLQQSCQVSHLCPPFTTHPVHTNRSRNRTFCYHSPLSLLLCFLCSVFLVFRLFLSYSSIGYAPRSKFCIFLSFSNTQIENFISFGVLIEAGILSVNGD